MQDLEQIYDEYVDKVYKYFYIQCLDRHSAEDLTSHTFISFIEKLKVKKVDDNKKYLYAIMRNVWMDHLRTKYKQAVESIESIEDFEQHAEQAITVFESRDLKERAFYFINRLPEKQAQVARMRLIEGYNLREIAKELGKSMSYVKTTQNRALKSLRLMLEQPELGGIVS